MEKVKGSERKGAFFVVLFSLGIIYMTGTMSMVMRIVIQEEEERTRL